MEDDDGTSSPFSIDVEFIDDLLLQGCWLETTNGSEFPHHNPFNSTALFDPCFSWSEMEIGVADSYTNPSPNNDGNDELQGRNAITATTADHNNQSMTDVDTCEMGRRWWIAPTPHLGSSSSSSVVDRLIRAIGYVKDFSRDKDVLVQVWVPVSRGNKRVLSTHDLLFSMNTTSIRLARYRDISVNYHFSADKDSNDAMGLPGRVFSSQIPEWSPDVRLFRNDEYPRVNYAQECDVRGTLALPVFEQGSMTCLGVIEVIMTTQQIRYQPELDNICKALEAVSLRSSDVVNTPIVKAPNRSYEAVVPEIQDVLRFACETHRLPLAQTWVPCLQQGREGCRLSDGNYIHCVSTVDRACYVADPCFQDFHEACSEHHLLKGQGVAGSAFNSNQPCFSTDITFFGNTEYPLSHLARMFDLHAAVAIRFRSIYTRKADFVLEFFLPVDCKDPEEQRKMLSSLSIIVRQYCRSLRVITDEELKEESENLPLELDDVVQVPSEVMNLPEDSCYTACDAEIQQHDGSVLLLLEGVSGEALAEKSSGTGEHHEDSKLKGTIECSEECSTFGEGKLSNSNVGKKREKRGTKAEETITVQVLRKYFAGSLKDAAKSLGVCPTTLKRICRQHGIKRWPSRKIKKVGHSLQKLQLVIDSVQGASGACQIGSLFTDLAELASAPNPSGTGSSQLITSKMGDHPKTSSIVHEGGMIFSHSQGLASNSHSSSCSHSSSSSHCCSSHNQQQHLILWADSDPTMGENSVGDKLKLKRAKSDEELHVSSRQGINPLRKSHSQKSLIECPGERVAHLPKMTNQKDDVQKVKVSYGDVRIRFRMHSSWGFTQLVEEVGRRFDISDISKYDVKYLDDDCEWVLLTCDADLEECIDVSRSSQIRIIKLSVHPSRRNVRS